MISSHSLISIITVVWNNQATIKDAINSILSQTYKNIEYIIIDGNSTDGTVEIIQNYGNKITKFISEPDSGIYEAMNKGIELATGDIVGILNSDDFYTDKLVLQSVIDKFIVNGVDSVYADLDYVDFGDTQKIVRRWRSQEFHSALFKTGWHPAHPAFFIRREIYLKYGLFNLSFKIAADYEIMLRFLEKHKISTVYLPKVLVKMRNGGTSNRNIKNIIKANIESYRAWTVNNLHISPLRLLYKPASKLNQFLKK